MFMEQSWGRLRFIFQYLHYGCSLAITISFAFQLQASKTILTKQEEFIFTNKLLSLEICSVDYSPVHYTISFDAFFLHIN